MARILDFSDGFESSVQPTASPVAASEISNTPSGNLSATTMQGAAYELQGDIDTINASKGAINGIATLGSDGKVPLAQMPALAITEVYVVANIAARNALTVEEGDVCQVTDAGGGLAANYIYDGTQWVTLQTDAALAAHEADTSTHGVTQVVGASEAQTLTNKDIDGGTASNTSRITLPKDTKGSLDSLTRKAGTVVYGTDTLKAYIDNGTSLVAIGSGSGSGGLNYITNPDFETDLSGWSTYADAAATTPVDGTGGTASSTLTRSTSSPLASTASAVWTKSAANRQGEGFSFDFTIDAAYRGQQLSIGYLSQVVSGTYAAGDMVCYIRDLTNSVNIQPSAFQVAPTSLAGPAQPLVFQTAINSSSYRLIFHTATASTSAYTLKFDNFSVGPQVVPVGAAMTDWTAVTSLTNSWSANSSYSAWRRRVGSDEEYRVKVSLVGSPSGTFTLALTDRTIDTAKLANYSSLGNVIGIAKLLDAGTRELPGLVDVLNSTTIQLKAGNSTNGSLDGSVTNTYPFTFASTDSLQFEFKVPILGWSSNTVVSDSAASRDVAARYAAVGGQSIATSSFVIMDYATKTTDTHGKVTTGSSWKFTSPTVGNFNVTATATFTAFSSAASSVFLSIYKNGVAYSQGPITTTQAIGQNWAASVSDQVPMVPGDYIDIRVFQNTAGAQTIVANPAASTVAISQNQGPAQIQAATLVSCALSGSSTVVSSTVTDIVPTTSSVTAGTFSTATYTAGGPGRYKLFAMARTASGASWLASNSFFLYYTVNGGTEVEIGSMYVQANTTTPMTASGGDEIILAQGDTIKFRAFASQSVALASFKAQITRLSGVN